MDSRMGRADGKRYSLNDMVKVDCHDCSGCSACCRDMGQSVLLDPLDVHRLGQHLGQTFAQLMESAVELHVEDTDMTGMSFTATPSTVLATVQ